MNEEVKLNRDWIDTLVCTADDLPSKTSKNFDAKFSYLLGYIESARGLIED